MAKHPIQDRGIEIVLAILLIVVGCYLVWDAFDNRNKQLPWFARWFSFW
jgi:putative Mn2+ efflux pump MntP